MQCTNIIHQKKSREKNIGLEEARKRTEASLARKRINVNLANANGANPEQQNSPANNGAMDSLLEKLRAAAPQAKDQRDRRRRARLKERHNVRVASGQHVPDGAGEEGKEENENAGDGEPKTDENGLLSPPIPEDGDPSTKDAQTSEGEDIADRAASMLLGLRSNSDAGGGERQRRRRESADEERRNRRMRRRNGATGSKDSADGSGLPAVQEPMSPTGADSIGGDGDDQPLPSPPQEESQLSAPPSIIVSDQNDDDHQKPSDHAHADGTSANHPIELSD